MMNPEIAHNVREFLVGLEELTAQTGVVISGLTEEFAPVLELQTDADVVVARMVAFEHETGAYRSEEPSVIDAKIAVTDD